MRPHAEPSEKPLARLAKPSAIRSRLSASEVSDSARPSANSSRFAGGDSLGPTATKRLQPSAIATPKGVGVTSLRESVQISSMSNDEKNANGRAVAYVRVSSKRQVEEGVSLEAQVASVKQYASLRGLTLAEGDIFIEQGNYVRDLP